MIDHQRSIPTTISRQPISAPGEPRRTSSPLVSLSSSSSNSRSCSDCWLPSTSSQLFQAPVLTRAPSISSFSCFALFQHHWDSLTLYTCLMSCSKRCTRKDSITTCGCGQLSPSLWPSPSERASHTILFDRSSKISGTSHLYLQKVSTQPALNTHRPMVGNHGYRVLAPRCFQHLSTSQRSKTGTQHVLTTTKRLAQRGFWKAAHGDCEK